MSDNKQTHDRNARIEAALDAAIAELEESNLNGDVTADLIGAREEFRELVRDHDQALQVCQRLAQVDAALYSAIADNDPHSRNDYVTTCFLQARESAAALREAITHGDAGEKGDPGSALWSIEETLTRAQRVHERVGWDAEPVIA